MSAPQDQSWKNNNFDFLRFVGALLVFVSHATFIPSGTLWADPLYAVSGGQMTIGWVGVGLFFAISGFLITASWERRRSPGAFAWARALRIYPALIAVVLGIFVVGGLISTDPNYFRGAPRYLGNVLVPFSDNSLPGVFRDQPAHTVSDNFWTLRYEIGCYALLALMGTLRVWRRDTVLVLFLLVSVLFALDPVTANNGWFDIPRYFLAGAVAYLYRERIPWRGSLALLALAGLIVTALTGGMKLGFSVFGTYLTLYLAYAPWLRAWRFGKRGDFSYGLYLSGFFVQQLVQRANPGLGALANFAVSFPLALSVAVVLWYAVEKPALAFKNAGGRPRAPRSGKTQPGKPRPGTPRTEKAAPVQYTQLAVRRARIESHTRREGRS